MYAEARVIFDGSTKVLEIALIQHDQKGAALMPNMILSKRTRTQTLHFT